MVPGDPVANMYGATYGANPLTQGIALLQDRSCSLLPLRCAFKLSDSLLSFRMTVKLGQYLKLPPRVTFLCQVLGTVVGAVLNCQSSPLLALDPTRPK